MIRQVLLVLSELVKRGRPLTALSLEPNHGLGEDAELSLDPVQHPVDMVVAFGLPLSLLHLLRA